MKASFCICSLVLFKSETANRWFAEPALIQGYHFSATAFKVIGADSAKLLDKILKNRNSRTLLLHILQVKIRLREKREG